MVSALTAAIALDAQTECRHHWVIDSAGGPTSWGTCKRCAARREFHNSCPGVEWERSASDSLRSSAAYPLWWEQLRPLRIVSVAEPEQAEGEAC